MKTLKISYLSFYRVTLSMQLEMQGDRSPTEIWLNINPLQLHFSVGHLPLGLGNYFTTLLFQYAPQVREKTLIMLKQWTKMMICTLKRGAVVDQFIDWCCGG
mmetsp:Transcript_800/g.1297  ORF Transcript_800/g.1297 Transcript_800/m.1297 type:complete len:102 (+) Transcript_800:2385-2690(+)